MISYSQLEDLFRAILKESLTIEGRFYMGHRYGLQEINYDNLGQVVDNIKAKPKYPLAMLAPPHSYASHAGKDAGWEEYRLVMFFMDQSYTKQVSKDNKTSQQAIPEDWQAMKVAAKNFIHALLNIQYNTMPTPFVLPSNKVLYIPMSNIGADAASGIRLDFNFRLHQDCKIEDYEGGEYPKKITLEDLGIIGDGIVTPVQGSGSGTIPIVPPSTLPGQLTFVIKDVKTSPVMMGFGKPFTIDWGDGSAPMSYNGTHAIVKNYNNPPDDGFGYINVKVSHNGDIDEIFTSLQNGYEWGTARLHAIEGVVPPLSVFRATYGLVALPQGLVNAPLGHIDVEHSELVQGDLNNLIKMAVDNLNLNSMFTNGIINLHHQKHLRKPSAFAGIDILKAKHWDIPGWNAVWGIGTMKVSYDGTTLSLHNGNDVIGAETEIRIAKDGVEIVPLTQMAAGEYQVDVAIPDYGEYDLMYKYKFAGEWTHAYLKKFSYSPLPWSDWQVRYAYGDQFINIMTDDIERGDYGITHCWLHDAYGFRISWVTTIKELVLAWNTRHPDLPIIEVFSDNNRNLILRIAPQSTVEVMPVSAWIRVEPFNLQIDEAEGGMINYSSFTYNAAMTRIEFTGGNNLGATEIYIDGELHHTLAQGVTYYPYNMPGNHIISWRKKGGVYYTSLNQSPINI